MDPNTTVPPNPPPVVMPPSSKRNIEPSFFIAIAMLLLGVAAGYLIAQKKTQISTPSQLSPTPYFLSSPAPTGDPTANWKTYVNEHAHFSVKIPPDAVTKSRDPDPFPIAIEINNLKPRVGGGGGPQMEGWLMTVSEPQLNNEMLSLVEWAKKTKFSAVKSFDESQAAPYTNTTVDNRPAITWAYPDVYKYYLVQKNSTEVVFITVNKGDPANTNDSIFDLILSTFKFLGQTSDASGWKTYESKGLGFQFKYPESWYSGNCNDENLLLLNPNGAPVCETEPSDPIVFSVIPNMKTIKEYEDMWKNDFNFKTIPKEHEVASLTTKRYLIEKIGSVPGPEKTEITVIQLNDKVAIFQLDDFQYSNILDQILSTFKLTD